jgi:hypothetical protein
MFKCSMWTGVSQPTVCNPNLGFKAVLSHSQNNFMNLLFDDYYFISVLEGVFFFNIAM